MNQLEEVSVKGQKTDQMINSKLDKIKSKSDELTAVLESMF